MSFLGVSPVDAHEKTGDTFLGAANTLLLLPTFSLLSGSKESPFTLAIYTALTGSSPTRCTFWTNLLT
jgi:hypothetical protein